MGDKCVSLKNSSSCPAFKDASVSTNSKLINLYPFLRGVSSVKQFDDRLSSYVNYEYVAHKYRDLMGCDNVQLSNTTSLYARYTTSVICNGIVQNSKEPCELSDDKSRPLCADTCAEAATSEELIAVNEDVCGTTKKNFMDQIRADFADCSIPADSLSGKCISGHENEPDECGYGSNLIGLCGFCSKSSPNATDSCCVASDAEDRCHGVKLPSPTKLPPLITSTSSSTPSSTTTAASGGLSGGAIAGIVVGSVAGVALLGALAGFLFICLRRRKRQNSSVFNQPTPSRQGAGGMRQIPGSSNGQQVDHAAIAGGRVARMSALQNNGSSPRTMETAKYHDSSDSDAFTSPAKSKRTPPVTNRRNGSLSSTSMLADTMSPGSGAQFSSPEGAGSGQSEQLPYFRDYYSEDDIHPNDKVAVLWAYQPRAADEFELDRGDMLKVVGIWDDGWATGVRLDERAEDYDEKHKAQRDSGVSNGSDRRGSSPSGEIKAFPLVCVCLPEHWHKTVDGDFQARASMDYRAV